MDREVIVYAICVRCGHPVAEHQIAWGTKSTTNRASLYGCSICSCVLTEVQKIRAWGGQ